MPFDEILRRSIDSLINDLGSAVQAEREDAAKRARDAAEATAAAALAQAKTAAERRGIAAGREEGLTEGRRQGFNQGRQEGYEAGKREGFQAGKDAGFENGKAEGFRAGKDEGFAAGKDEGYRVGKEHGYSAGRNESGTEGDAADLKTGERLAEALRAIDRARSLSEILDTLASCAGREASRAAVLLVRDSKLVGWRFVGFGAALEQGTAFEAPLTESGIIGEAVRSEAAIGGESSSAASPPPFAEASADCERLAIPIAIGGQVIAALYADRGAADREARPPRFAWRSAVEMLASHAARALEAVTAFRTAQLMTEAAGAPKPSGSPASSEGEHAARRYARLLVSEIKLYHGAEVAAGRRERDLATRLGGEITRARALYEQRAASHRPGTADYFEEELVRTLADGDASLL
jgi:hypothetical protein